MKLSISLDDDLVRRIDNCADENYMSRSGLISLACSQYLISLDVQIALKELALTMRRIADNNSIDEDSKKQLEDFERLAKLLSGK